MGTKELEGTGPKLDPVLKGTVDKQEGGEQGFLRATLLSPAKSEDWGVHLPGLLPARTSSVNWSFDPSLNLTSHL